MLVVVVVATAVCNYDFLIVVLSWVGDPYYTIFYSYISVYFIAVLDALLHMYVYMYVSVCVYFYA